MGKKKKKLSEAQRKAREKKKLSPAQKRAKKEAKAERQKKYKWIFINGKQVRVKREPTIDGMSMDEYIQNNADPVWLHQNGMWEHIDPDDPHETNFF
jgi:hypothetical protein